MIATKDDSEAVVSAAGPGRAAEVGSGPETPFGDKGKFCGVFFCPAQCSDGYEKGEIIRLNCVG